MLIACALQVAEQKPVEESLGNLAKQGILGSICVILIVALYLTVRALLKAKDDRLADQKAMSEALLKVNEATKDLTVEMKEHAAHQTIEASKSQESVRSALATQERSFTELKGAVAEAKTASSEAKTALATLQQEQERLAKAVDGRYKKTG